MSRINYVPLVKGTECLNKTLHAFFKEEGIKHQTTTQRTPEHNGVVERRNHTLVEAARTMLSASKLPLFFWAEAIATACYTQNRSIIIPTHEKTTYHIINDRKPSIKHLHIFCCTCYITRDGENLDKMKEKGDPCILVRYSTKSKEYHVKNKRTRLIVESIHLIFDEIKEMTETFVANDSSGFVPQRQKASDRGTSSVNKSSSPIDNSKQHDTPPTTNNPSSTEPTTPTNVNAEENKLMNEFKGIMPTKIELTLEQSQQGVSNDVLSTSLTYEQSTTLPRVHVPNVLPTHPILQQDFIPTSEIFTLLFGMILLANFCLTGIPHYLLSCGDEDTIFDPGISKVSSSRPDVPHRRSINPCDGSRSRPKQVASWEAPMHIPIDSPIVKNSQFCHSSRVSHPHFIWETEIPNLSRQTFYLLAYLKMALGLM
ncbi:retrovirus-related pol polyprotein from transposon TNT 1-94 [Tanacetum coccineum]